MNRSHSAIHRAALTVNRGIELWPATSGPLSHLGCAVSGGRATREVVAQDAGRSALCDDYGLVTPMKLVLAALTSLAVTIGMGMPARADTTDDAFIASLRAAGFTFSDAGQAITAAHYVCHAADGGTAMADIAKAIQSKDSALSDEKATKFTTIAANAYCPQALSPDSSSSSTPASSAPSAPNSAPSSAPSSAPTSTPTGTPSPSPSNDRAVPRSTIS